MDICDIRNRLVKMGFDVFLSRFPYTYHHDWWRQRNRDGGFSRADVAGILLKECGDSENEKYTNSVIYGAILYLIQEQPEKITHELVDILEEAKNGSIYKVKE